MSRKSTTKPAKPSKRPPGNPSESKPLDCEDWQIAFEPYAGHPVSALILAQHFAKLKDYAATNAADATAAIDRAIDCLFRHSQFREASRRLFLALVDGTITPEEEAIVRLLAWMKR
jgi:hypothetical protein